MAIGEIDSDRDWGNNNDDVKGEEEMEVNEAYKELKSILRPGDIIFFSPKDLWFRFIEYWTRDKWGHVGVVLDNKEAILLIEAIPRGIEVTNVLYRLNLKQDLTIYRFENAKKEQLDKFIRKVSSFVGRGYDFKSLANFIIGKAKFRSKKKCFCSELIYRGLIAGRMIRHSEQADIVSPHDLRLLIENVATNIQTFLVNKRGKYMKQCCGKGNMICGGGR